MRTVDENIDTLAGAILSEARAEAEHIQAEAQGKADAIRKRAEEQAGAGRKEILDRARQEAERLRSQAVATTQLKARKLQLEHREKLLDDVFKAARQQLPAMQTQADYEAIVCNLLREALTQLGASKARVRADKFTQTLLVDHVLDEIAKEMNAELQIGQPLEKGTGLIVDSEDGHLHYDNTLETRLNRMQGTLRSSVYHILMGKSL